MTKFTVCVPYYRHNRAHISHIHYHFGEGYETRQEVYHSEPTCLYRFSGITQDRFDEIRRMYNQSQYAGMTFEEFFRKLIG